MNTWLGPVAPVPLLDGICVPIPWAAAPSVYLLSAQATQSQ